MLVGQQGYVPEPYFLTETLRSQTRFHDPLQDSLFSNAGSVQGFREWSSGKSSPQPILNGNPTANPDSQGRTLLVRSSCPIGHSSTLEPNVGKHVSTQPRCVHVSENVYEAQLPTLVTPRTKVPGGSGSKSIRYAILEVSPGYNVDIIIFHSGVLHSGIHSWTVAIWTSKVCTPTFKLHVLYTYLTFTLNRLDSDSDGNRAQLHLRCFCNSAWDRYYGIYLQCAQLSFGGSRKDRGNGLLSLYSMRTHSILTKILTGAQIPLSQLRNDAVDNLMGALTIAGHYIIPGNCQVRYWPHAQVNKTFLLECCLYFNHTLFRGNRVTKMSSYDLSAFNSPNFPPLVNGRPKRNHLNHSRDSDLFVVGIDIIVNWADVIRQTSLRRFRAHKGKNYTFSRLTYSNLSTQT